MVRRRTRRVKRHSTQHVGRAQVRRIRHVRLSRQRDQRPKKVITPAGIVRGKVPADGVHLHRTGQLEPHTAELGMTEHHVIPNRLSGRTHRRGFVNQSSRRVASHREQQYQRADDCGFKQIHFHGLLLYKAISFVFASRDIFL